ncbi:MAG: hypothetical protein MMC33_005297 [Icmadophila ericetorum]|nr:hypothetical protein [Icmadophila ericetorum]
MEKQKVAVVGGGAFGLAAVKNLRDEGFDVTCFEKRNTIGGLWASARETDITSTLPTTLSNVTKYRSCYTDFPVPDEAPPYLPAPDVYEYIKSYAKHFDLYPHIKLNTTVRIVTRNEDDTQWQLVVVDAAGEATYEFDKILFCQGATEQPHLPKFDGRESFTGEVIHSQAYKEPAVYKGKRVLVVGLGNTAADTAAGLVGHAEKIYISHRRSAVLLPRRVFGQPLDLAVSRRMLEIKQLTARWSPRISRWIFDKYVQYLMTSSFEFDPAWRMYPPPTVVSNQPTINDKLISCLQAGSITSVHCIRRFVDATTVELEDDTRLEIDAVILCTGYRARWDMVPDVNPTDHPSTLDFIKRVGYNGPPLPRLYQNIFPPEFPDSIAFLNCFALTEGVVPMADLASMAIAQVWAGHYQLPSKEAMNTAIDKNHLWVAALARDDKVYAGIVDDGPWLRFLNDAAGTGVNENLGYGLRGWLYWLREPRFCHLLMTGVISAHVFRLFDGRRKKWIGAKDAILRANSNAKLPRA